MFIDETDIVKPFGKEFEGLIDYNFVIPFSLNLYSSRLFNY